MQRHKPEVRAFASDEQLPHSRQSWRRRVGVACLMMMLSASAGCEGCDRIDPPVDEVACNFESAVQAVPDLRDPCEQGQLIINPVDFPRTTGAPNRYSEAFVLSRPGRVCVSVENFAGRSGRVSSARIEIDGIEVLGPDSFNQRVLAVVAVHPKSDDLTAGEHTLDARVASNPGASLRVEVRFLEALSESDMAAIEELATLQEEACEQFNEELRLQGPILAAQTIERLIRIGSVPGQMAVRLNAYGVPRLLDPLPVEDFSQLEDDPPEVVAQKWLDHHRDMLRWTRPEVQLIFDYIKPSRHGPSHVRFEQRIGGLKVDNAQLELVVNADQVRRLTGHFVPDLPPSFSPQLDANTAGSLALQADNTPTAPGVVGEPALVLFDVSPATGKPGLALSWRVKLGTTVAEGPSGGDPDEGIAARPPRLARVWIDALTGEVLATDSLTLNTATFENFRAEGEFQFDVVDGSVTVTQPALATSVFDPPLVDLGCTTDPDLAWCRHFVDGAFSLDVQWRTRFGRAGWSNGGIPDSPGGVPGIPPDDAYRMVLDVLNFPSGAIHWRVPPPNPYYEIVNGGNGASIPGHFISFGPLGLGIGSFGDSAPTFDVVRHEIGHGFFQVELGDRGDGFTSSSISVFHEHVADFWAMACDPPSACCTGSRISRDIVPVSCRELIGR